LIEVNLALSLLPSRFTIAMIASEMPDAINPYSIAVAPDSKALNGASQACATSAASAVNRSLTQIANVTSISALYTPIHR
jgi:hypothetical protein